MGSLGVKRHVLCIGLNYLLPFAMTFPVANSPVSGGRLGDEAKFFGGRITLRNWVFFVATTSASTKFGEEQNSTSTFQRVLFVSGAGGLLDP